MMADGYRLVAPAHLVLDHGYWNGTAVLYACLAVDGLQTSSVI